MSEVFVLLEDADATMHSSHEPFGVAVSSKAEAEAFVNEYPAEKWRRSYQSLRIFETTKEAMAWRYPDNR